MITDFTDFNGRPITPGVTVVVAVATKYGSRIALRKGKVYRVGLHSIGVDVVFTDRNYTEKIAYRVPKRMIII